MKMKTFECFPITNGKYDPRINKIINNRYKDQHG